MSKSTLAQKLKFKVNEFIIKKFNFTEYNFFDIKFVINENTTHLLNDNIKCFSNLKGHITLLDMSSLDNLDTYYSVSNKEFDIISIIKEKNDRIEKKKLEDLEYKKALDAQVDEYNNLEKKINLDTSDVFANNLTNETNEPTNEQINEPTNEPTNEPINEPVSELTKNQKKINNYHEQLMNMKTNNKINRRIMKSVISKFKLKEIEALYFEMKDKGITLISNELKIFELHDKAANDKLHPTKKTGIPQYILIVGELMNKTAFIENIDQAHNREERLKRQEEFVDKVKKIEEKNKEII